MSIVIAVGNKNVLYLAGDGRQSDVDSDGNRLVISESFQKVKMVTDKIAIGLTGIVEECVATVENAYSGLVNNN